MFEITTTPEWREFLEAMRVRQAQYMDKVFQKMRYEDLIEIKIAIGQYDGFRQAIEYAEGLGKKE